MNSEITSIVLTDFKQRMRITHSSEDDYLKQMLSASFADIKAKCGEFLLDENERGKELVFERARYAFNDSLEYFEGNFRHQLHSLGLELWGDGTETV